MAYVRQRGNQLAIVHGEREPNTGAVQQRILFTLYSKPEALEVLGRGTKGGAERFRRLLEDQYPELKFNWKGIRRSIENQLDVLPDRYQYRPQRLRARFRDDLCGFVRQLILADPQDLDSAAQLIAEHRYELEYLADLIAWRLKLREQPPNEWSPDTPFYWRLALQGRNVPPDTEEHAAGFYERGEYDRARAVFRLLVDCFNAYAEGYNYLGLIALEQRKLDEAIEHFRKTIEMGRKRFPPRISRTRYWSDHATRPYMRGLRNLALTLNEAGGFSEALAVCDRLVDECGDELTAAWHRATVSLNIGRWEQSADAARRTMGLNPSGGFLAAFAYFELDQRDQALGAFLHAALNHPRAARMLAGEKTRGKPTAASRDEAEDHNLGVSLLRSLHAYLRGQSPVARRFFRDVMRDARVVRLLDESVAVVRRWHAQHPTGEREAFDCMRVMRSPEFAQAEAWKLSDLLVARGARIAVSVH
jgi:tetratricopeptide (TPR) repeat protein